MPRTRSKLVGLALVTAASPFVLFICDRGLLDVVAPFGQPWINLVLTRPASFAVCGLLFLALGVRVAEPAPLWQSLASGFGFGAVLATIAAAAVVAGVRSPTLPGTAVVGFLAFGLLAEELLFRGMVFEAFQRVLPRTEGLAIIGSALLFAISHFGYHSFRPTPEALWQVAYTVPLGLALGWLRLRTGRIAPSALAHLMFNLSGLSVSHLVA